MKYFLLGLLIISSSLFFSCSYKDDITQKPNVLIIITDDQGYGDIGRHGNSIIQTPNLDKLYDESIRFSNFHVATTCAPTRAGLMSGLHCNRVGAWHTINGRSFVASRFPTMADHFRSADYTTGIFGKWHLGDNHPYRPQDRGFDEVLIHGGGGVGQTPDYWNNDYYDDTYFHNGVPEKYNGFCTDVWFEEAQKFMTKVSKKGNPFFCYLATNAPHGPHHVPQQYIDKYKGKEDVVNPNFYGQITNIDDNMGRLMKSLEETGVLDNTIVVFLTDNGTAGGAALDKKGHVTKGFNAGMRGKKVWEYEGGHRVPLFIKTPSDMGYSLNAYNELITYTDLLPTLLDLANIPNKEEGLDGVSLYPLITKNRQEELKERIVIIDTQREDLVVKYKRYSVMKDKWRLVNGKELYDINIDPGQQSDIISDHPIIAKSLMEAYEVWWEDFQEDILEDNRISIGHSAENPSLLTSHDYHAEKTSPWHQRHIRAGILQNGHWKLNVARSGDYTIKLYRWPPSLNIAMNEGVSEGDHVEGGDPFKVGLGFDARNAKVKIQNIDLESGTLVDEQYFQFDVTLKEGPADLKSWITLNDGNEVGAYYIDVEKL